MTWPSHSPSVGRDARALEGLPLVGVRFLEVGEDFACAYAGHLLSLLGAEVVRVPGPAAAGATGRAPGPSMGPAAGRVPGRAGAESWGLDGGKFLFFGEVTAESLAGLSVAAAVDSTGALGGESFPLGGESFPVVHAASSPNPARAWASSGAMALTGRADGPPLLAPGDVASCLEGAALAFRLLAASRGAPGALDGAALLGERAAILGHHRHGAVSNGGACRLVAANDGWLAVSLSRESDVDLVPAWLEETVREDPWVAVASFARGHRARPLADRAQLLGIPVAVVGGGPDCIDEQLRARGQQWPPTPWLLEGTGPCLSPPRMLTDLARLGPSRPASRRRPLVVDLSALWAGPLAASLLVAAGCRVVKVEDPRRPDPSRAGPQQFVDLLHGGKESVTVPVAATGPFPALIGSADVVIEASRPRALEQLGISAHSHQAWISITGYGRAGPWRNRVALGDDAAASGGLVTRQHEGGPPLFCADAAADPITGLHAAVAALAAVVGDRGGTTDIAMREVVGHALAHGRPAQPRETGPVAPPRSRTPTQRAPEMGAHTDSVLADL
jgi:crotonobetainyl-CoA:carnitine CoA-transferase CaiB-like acyl-CoA transferase